MNKEPEGFEKMYNRAGKRRIVLEGYKFGKSHMIYSRKFLKMNKKIETKELVKFMKERVLRMRHHFEEDAEIIYKIIERLELHDVYKEGIEKMVRRLK